MEKTIGKHIKILVSLEIVDSSSEVNQILGAWFSFF